MGNDDATSLAEPDSHKSRLLRWPKLISNQNAEYNVAIAADEIRNDIGYLIIPNYI